MRFFIFVSTIFLLSSCGESTQLSETTTVEKEEVTVDSTIVKSELEFLKTFKDKYTHDEEVTFFENEVIKTRFLALLGQENFDFLSSIWEVTTPIEVYNETFYAWAMQAHSGGDPGAIIMADIKEDVFYIGIRNDGHVDSYAENEAPIPNRFAEWAEEN